MPVKGPSAKYRARAEAFARAIDLGIVLMARLPPEEREGMTQHALDCKARALAPAPPFATLRSLAYLEDAVLTYWNEATGAHVESFWQQVAERGLPFQRKDALRVVLNRGRVNSDVEYQTIVDSIVIGQQTGRISPAEAVRLARMIAAFEARPVRRRRPT